MTLQGTEKRRESLSYTEMWSYSLSQLHPIAMIQNQTLDNYTQNNFCKIFAFQTITANNVGKDFHRHNYFQIILLNKGKAKHWIDFEHKEVEAPYISVIFPNQMHKLELSEEAEAQVIMFDETVFCSAILSNELKDYNIDLQNRLNHVTVVPSTEWSHILGLYQDILDLFGRINMVRKMQIKFMIKIILLKIIDFAPNDVSIGHVDADIQVYQKFREAVNKEFATQRKVLYYADLLGVSTKKLNAICNKYTGASPLDIIHEKLSLELKKSFVEEGLTLKDIAFRFGFSSQSALNKFIEKRFGCTPQAWRAELEKNMMGK